MTILKQIIHSQFQICIGFQSFSIHSLFYYLPCCVIQAKKGIETTTNYKLLTLKNQSTIGVPIYGNRPYVVRSGATLHTITGQKHSNSSIRPFALVWWDKVIKIFRKNGFK